MTSGTPNTTAAHTTRSPQIYEVGGAVRDSLLGLPVSDRDWVVVGATPDDMLKQGYRPVGKDFPVFLHPHTQEEYALARTERKTAPGYAGFSFYAAPDITLEQDLQRRDLTINAMARDAQGNIHDPYGGQRDLAARVLRHVSDAFAEDPVRILRIARFAARYADFTVAPETLQLMHSMVLNGEVDALVPERVWQEISRGLMERKPSRMLQVLRDCGALQRILPEVHALYGVPQKPEVHPEVDTGIHLELVLDAAAERQAPLPARVAALCHDLGKGATPAEVLPNHGGHEQRSVPLTEALCARLRVPADCRDVAILVAREHGEIHDVLSRSAENLTLLLERLDVMRRPERLDMILQAVAADFHGRPGYELREFKSAPYLIQAAGIFRGVDAGAIARECSAKSEAANIPAAVHAARCQALREALSLA